MSEFYSLVQYAGSADGDTDFTISFPYLRRDHVYVFVDDLGISRPGSWDFISDSMIRLNTPLAENSVVTIRRFTYKDTRLANYHDGSILTELELNEVSKQLLYLIQETLDYRQIQEDGDPVPGGDGQDPLTESDLDQIINQLGDSELFQDLFALIDLVDINAETVMAGILSTHLEWSVREEHKQLIREADQIIDQHGVDIGEHDARVDVIENEVIGPESALAQHIVALGASYDGNASNIVQLAEAITNDTLSQAENTLVLKTDFEDSNATIIQQMKTYADEESAAASDVKALDASLFGNTGWITQIGETKVDADHVTSRLTEELGAEWINDGRDATVEGLIQTSSYIDGVKTTAENGLSKVEAVRSFLVGTSNDPLFDEPIEGWDPNSFIGTVSGLQEEVDGRSDDISTSISFVRDMASLFGGSENDTPAIASAIQTELETYADSESATAKRVDTYMAQTAPIFFSDTPPDITVAPWSDTEYYHTGFPDGAHWYQQYTHPDGTLELKSFVWQNGRLSDVSYSNFVGIDSASQGVDWFYKQGRYDGTLGYLGRGAWVNQNATAIGGVIQSISDVDVSTSGRVDVMLKDLVQAVSGDLVSAVDTKIENYIDPQTGMLNSQYMVRANQYIDGQPVIAGFGLGLQSDADNPNDSAFSNFAVMADYFTVMAPPTGPALTDPIDTLSERVPFLVDGDGRVYISGDLFVEDNLYAYSGRFDTTMHGRAIFGQMQYKPGYSEEFNPDFINQNWESMIDDMGFRMELLSSTNGYWTGPDRNYLIWAGTGNRNDNNAVFWLDENGNSYFAGQVQAENISGRMANVEFNVITLTTPLVVPKNDSGWHPAGTTQVFDIDSLRLLRPSIQVSVRFENSKTGSFRLRAKYEDPPGSGNFSAAVTLDETSRDHDRLWYQNEVQLWGIPGVDKDGNGSPVNIRGKVHYWVEVSNPFDRDNSPDVTVPGWKALVMALPQSKTPAAGPDSTSSDTGDVGSPTTTSIPPGGGTDTSGTV